MNWFEVFKESKSARLCTAGPKTRGGRMVASVKSGDSCSMKSQAAFSANVLLAGTNGQERGYGRLDLHEKVVYQNNQNQHSEGLLPW